METKFKVGDIVRIVSRNSAFFGHTGVITLIDAYATRLVFHVRIDCYPGDRGGTFYEENLIQVGVIDEQDKLTEKYASHDAKALAEAYTRYYKHKQIVTNYTSDFIVNVVFNDPATIVLWKDNTKTVVKACEDENFDPEKGLAMAIAKKALGNKGNYYETFKKWLPEEDKLTPYEMPRHSGKYPWGSKENLESMGRIITIDEVTPDDLTKIIDARLPFGLFYCKDGKKYIGVDNINGDAFTEEFKTKKACLEWLKTERD